jgi:TRAP-type C4-dicarboxylate transport system permease small subunit
MKLAERLSRGLRLIETAFMYGAATGMVAIMMIVVVDVVLRYVFSAPLSWSYDVVSMYLVSFVIFLALAESFRRGVHIKVDLIQRLRGTRVLAAAELVGYAASLLLFGLILQLLVSQGLEAFFASDVVDGAIPWPTWPPYFIAALGTGLLWLRMLLSLALRLIAFASGRPADPESDERSAEGGH